MVRITINDVKAVAPSGEIYNLVNAIRNSLGGYFSQYVPLANADNVAEVGAGILMNQTTQNEFINALINRIGMTIVRNVSIQNPLSKFKSGRLDMGSTIQEIMVDLCKEHLYDPEVAETELFKREIPDVKVLYHEIDRQGFFKQTVSREQLRQAFTSWNDLGSLVSNITGAMYNSAELNEYKYMKLAVDTAYSKGFIAVEKLSRDPLADPPNTPTGAQDLIRRMRAMYKRFTMPMGSRNYNALAVHTRSLPEDVHILISAELDAIIDVNVLAQAFNVDKTTFLGNVTVIDELGSGKSGETVHAIMFDKSFFMVKDVLQEMNNIYNPQGLSWNFMYHVWQVISTSRFANAVAFVYGSVPEITSVILDPPYSTLKRGGVGEITATIRKADPSVNPTLTWTLAPTDGGSTTGITVTPSASGLSANVTYGETATGTAKEVKITCTASWGVSPNEKALTTSVVVGLR